MNWKQIIKYEQQQNYYKLIVKLIKSDETIYNIFPPKKDIFNAFKYCDFENTKVVILGQDPYHNINQAHGLSFSVLPNNPIPPSLKNIYKELKNDLNVEPPNHGHLLGWAKQGVLLLNSILTVRQNQPSSHKNVGWQRFTDKIISVLDNKQSPIVFILWGNYARSKKSLITNNKHLILESAHPSPMSAHNGFFGSKPFSKTNEFLKQNNLQEIDWGKL